LIDTGARWFVAAAVTAFAASVIGMLAVLVYGLIAPTAAPIKPNHIIAIVGITLFWAPVIAFVPAAIIGLLVERPKAKAMIARGHGGLLASVTASTLAGAMLALLFRLALYVFDPRKALIDPPVMAFFSLIGFCSGLAWWNLVVVPGRKS
jgi:hypothetical protein